jgi:hypothetical protein
LEYKMLLVPIRLERERRMLIIRLG